MSRQALDIVIVGGGIAGCSAAIALTAIGHKVRILEKQAAWRFQSSGIFVYSNGLRSMPAAGGDGGYDRCRFRCSRWAQ